MGYVRTKKREVKIEKNKEEVQLPLDIENELNNLRERVGK